MAIKKKQTPVEDYTPQRLLELWLSIVKGVKCKESKELYHALNSLKPSHVGEIFLLLESNKNVLVEVLKEYPRYLAFMPPSIRDDLDMVMLACKENPISIEKASLRIRDLQEVAEWSTQVKPPLLHLMSHRWSRDLELQKKALRTHPFYIRQLIRYKGSKDNKELIKASVQIHGYYLAYASLELRKDTELVRLAILTDGKASSRLQVNADTLLSPEILPTIIDTDISWLFNSLSQCPSSVKNERLSKIESVIKTIPEENLFRGFEALKVKDMFMPEGVDGKRILEVLLKHVSLDFVVKVRELFPFSRECYPDSIEALNEIIASKKLLAIKKGVAIPATSKTSQSKRRILKP